MKTISFCLSFFILLLTSSTLSAQHWLTNLEEAKDQAKTQERPILLVFQGSDWCAPCIKLEKEVWSSKAFLEYANEQLVLVQADFPRRKKNRLATDQEARNAILAEEYNRQGIFPLVALLDSEGKVLAETGYKDLTGEAYTSHLAQLLSSQ